MGLSVAEATEQVVACPRNAQCRHDLAVAYHDAGELRKAYAEARTAVALVRTYGRARRTIKSLEVQMKAAGVGFEDDDAEYLTVPVEEEEECVPAATDDEARAVAFAEKSAGNAEFVAKNYQAAVDRYTAAIEALRRRDLPADAKILSNRAAALLQLGQPVKAASDGRASAEADPDWWKAWWYFAQALIAVVKRSPRGACTANAERAQEAYRALEKCLAASTLPDDKRPDVQRLKDQAHHSIYQLTNQEGCCLQ